MERVKSLTYFTVVLVSAGAVPCDWFVPRDSELRREVQKVPWWNVLWHKLLHWPLLAAHRVSDGRLHVLSSAVQTLTFDPVFSPLHVCLFFSAAVTGGPWLDTVIRPQTQCVNPPPFPTALALCSPLHLQWGAQSQQCPTAHCLLGHLSPRTWTALQQEAPPPLTLALN